MRSGSDFYRDQTVLVTGGSGFVGSHLVRELREHGARVRVTRHRRPIERIDPSLEVVDADLTREDDCRRACRGVDFVFHAAGAVSSASTSGRAGMQAIKTNLVLTAQLIDAAWAEGVKRLLLFSSSTGYPPTDHPVREEEFWGGPPHPAYLGYGWMRRYLERLAEFAASRSRMKIAIARPTAVYGPGDDFDPATGHVVPALVRRSVEREDPFVVWGTGEEIRDFLHVRDLARGCRLLLEKHAECDAVNLGYGKGTSIREVVRIVLDAAGHATARVVFDPTRPTTIPVRLVDTAKASRLLGFEPAIALGEGLRETVRWFAELTRHRMSGAGEWQ